MSAQSSERLQERFSGLVPSRNAGHGDTHPDLPFFPLGQPRLHQGVARCGSVCVLATLRGNLRTCVGVHVSACSFFLARSFLSLSFSYQVSSQSPAPRLRFFLTTMTPLSGSNSISTNFFFFFFDFFFAPSPSSPASSSSSSSEM